MPQLKKRSSPKGQVQAALLKPQLPPVTFGGTKKPPVPLPYGRSATRTAGFPLVHNDLLLSEGFFSVAGHVHDRKGAQNTAYRDPLTKLYWRVIGK